MRGWWVAALLCACSAPPPAAPEVPDDADPWGVVDDGDALSLQLDLRLLRQTGAMPLVRGFLLRGLDPPCDVWIDADRIAVSIDAEGGVVGALSSPVALDEACALGDSRRAGGVTLFGEPARFAAAEERLAAPSLHGDDSMLIVRGSSAEANLERMAIELRAGAESLRFDMDLVPRRRDDQDAAQLGMSMKALLAELAAGLASEPEAGPLADALSAPKLQLSARGVRIAFEVEATPALTQLLSERGDSLFVHRPEGCERMIAGILARCL